MLPGMMNLRDSNSTGHNFVDALIGSIFLSRCQFGTQICKKTVFFCRLFIDNDYLSSQFYSFLAFFKFCLRLSVLPLTLAIKAFSFQSLPTFTFGLLLSPFTFPFPSKFSLPSSAMAGARTPDFPG